MKTLFRLCIGLSMILISACHRPADAKPQAGRPKNVILFIGDGMGLAQVQAAQLASDEPLNLLKANSIGFATTRSADHDVTDSGAGGTAIATGFKTRNGMIGMKPDSTEVPGMVELFAQKGYSTGVVVSCALTHATPASFLAHAVNRNLYEEIAADILQSPVDVLIGGGLKNFTARKDGRTLTKEMEDKGFTFLNHIPEKLMPDWKKLLIVTDSGHPEKVQNGRGDHLPKGVELALKQLSKNPKGFFLMVEGSQIDWACHANDSSYLIAEMMDFDQAIGRALHFQEKNPETLIVVTADHETGGLTFPKGAIKGSYRCEFSTGDHTGVAVPVYAFGPGAELFTGFYDNTDLIKKIMELTEGK